MKIYHDNMTYATDKLHKCDAFTNVEFTSELNQKDTLTKALKGRVVLSKLTK